MTKVLALVVTGVVAVAALFVVCIPKDQRKFPIIWEIHRLDNKEVGCTPVLFLIVCNADVFTRSEFRISRMSR